jgi:predicted TIM-barrel enzyme
MRFTKQAILTKLQGTITVGRPIIIAGAGTGISAKFEEAGGVDLIIIYNSGKYRMAGRGSIAGMMPYGDANAIVMEIANEVLPVIRHTPVLAGICGTDPFRSMDHFLSEIKEAGFSGVQNFPTVGIYDGGFRRELEETGISFQLEVQMIQKAGQLDLFTAPYVFTPEEAQSMARVGADMVVVHLGPTVQVGKKNQKRSCWWIRFKKYKKFATRPGE